MTELLTAETFTAESLTGESFPVEALVVGDPVLPAAALARVLNELSPEQLRDLAEGRGRLVYAPCAPPTRSRRPAAPVVDLSADVEAIREMRTRTDITDHLADRRFTVPVLRELARALGPTVPSTGRNRAELVHAIVEGTVGFRARSAALSGGAWL
ncbi:hypothetical protein I4I73_00070 [Pseudonocardia sp. KRD-184]|uniref:Rho termination factor N-terminal domain-containing protein n=1 Tax=Pseudonocardia oceani TaxID=2792013 RepID=A0ABS6UCU8_9PSEU|nr:hypothetical protein [Pseudonocardia oceani]MBW0089931.1 hypothetical protein [Pseudonocardia oceani]MBW0094407.1 hypothetical protein [Pseudonocardia oceani]MBW0107920.1 hypothetical protein [Pseudonocardia oceani]MBW0119986.1 hypothetical protein [Pseudonocardia oceani]MBW0130066.1 hypothetical protein [Pseudonocardia oceani]